MKNPQTVYNYLRGGNAIVTLTDTRKGEQFTYRVHKNRAKGWSVFLMVKPGRYNYIGSIKQGMFQHNGGSSVTEDSKSFGLFDCLIVGLTKRWAIPNNMEVHHAGICGRCGKTLTTPKSIETGFGSICRKIVYS